MREILTLAAAMALSPASSQGQAYVRDLRGIPFFRDSVAYVEPLSGGLNAPMQQFVDLDGDGDLDLFVFDNDFYPQRHFFRNTGSRAVPGWSLEPEVGFEGASFLFWFRVTDYDGDGAMELLTDDSSSGVRVWENAGTVSRPFWQLAETRLVDTSSTPVFAGFGSLPGFADLDGDSLPDFISGNSADGSFNYYRNTGTAGHPAYALVSNRFDGITILGDTCHREPAARPAGKPAAHGAGAVCLADIDSNGTADLFYGDIFSHSLFSLMNVGTPDAPGFECSADFYPPDGSLTTIGFNQGSFADIDGDGDDDLFVGVLNSRTTDSFWFYENEGTPAAPDFHLRTTDYIGTVDVGQNAHPALVDLDGDDDLDLVVGNNAGSLTLFRNGGNEISPVYQLEDTLFGGISGNYSYAPVFDDLDRDGDPDLVLGRFDGLVIIYLNEGPAGFVAADTIASGQYASPAVGDIDGDNDPDLIVGTGAGRLELYLNEGDSAHFLFQPSSDSSLGPDVGSNARPCLRVNDSTGRADLYVTAAAAPAGSADQGIIYYFRNTGTGSEPLFSAPVDGFGPGVPYEPALAFGDLDGDGDDDLLVGTSKGGLVYFRYDDPTGIDPRPGLPNRFGLAQNYPNPFNGSTVISYVLGTSAEVTLDVYDIRGAFVGRLAAGREGPGRHEVVWDAGTRPSGVYYARLSLDGRAQFIRMTLIR